MSEVQRTAPATDAPAQKVGRPGGRAGEKKALELIATRGREVIGVRHLLEGKTARIGDVREALARVPMNEIGGRSLVIGAVARGEHLLHVPPRARARMHAAGAIPRLLVGPQKITLAPGDRAVLVLGQIQIRARVVDIDALSGEAKEGFGIVRWIVFVVAIYIAALTVCAVVTKAEVPRLERGSLHRVQEEMLHRAGNAR